MILSKKDLTNLIENHDKLNRLNNETLSVSHASSVDIDMIIVADKENNDGAYIETGKPGEDKDRSKSRTKSRSEEKKERMVWSQ